jgi:hypothetical protein
MSVEDLDSSRIRLIFSSTIFDSVVSFVEMGTPETHIWKNFLIHTSSECFVYALLSLNPTWYQSLEKILGVGRCCHRCVALPLLVLVRV